TFCRHRAFAKSAWMASGIRIGAHAEERDPTRLGERAQLTIQPDGVGAGLYAMDRTVELDQPKGNMNEQYEYARIYLTKVAAGSARTLSHRLAVRCAVRRRHSRDPEVRKLRRSSRILRDTRRKAARRLRCMRSRHL